MANDGSKLGRARASLLGLSVGDGFGERFFGPSEEVGSRLAKREFPPAPWDWTDDTAMAISVVETLETRGEIDQDELARRFARRYSREPSRGYGGGAHSLLSAIASGADWRIVSKSLFSGQGSWGNGAAMRAAPIGAFFADSPERAVARGYADFAEAMWDTVSALGDRDTTCAIVGGIIAASGVAPPRAWIDATEALSV